MSVPIVPLTDEQRAEILALGRVQGEAHERIRQILIEAAEAYGIAREWLATHT